MGRKIEIYVRHSGAGTFLNLNVPEEFKEQFISAIRTGRLEGSDITTAVELPVLPEWVTDDEAREKVSGLNEAIHLRIPVTSFNVSFSKD